MTIANETSRIPAISSSATSRGSVADMARLCASTSPRMSSELIGPVLRTRPTAASRDGRGTGSRPAARTAGGRPAPHASPHATNSVSDRRAARSGACAVIVGRGHRGPGQQHVLDVARRLRAGEVEALADLPAEHAEAPELVLGLDAL